MAKKDIKEVTVPIEKISGKIYLIRDQKVILDRDLADLYEVETKQLKRAVRRNIDRFPRDFMFELTKSELENWRYQFGTSKGETKGLRYKPMAFTEQGVAMLSSVLRSKRAIHVNIRFAISDWVMRIYHFAQCPGRTMGWGGRRSKTYWRQGASQAGTGRKRKSFQIGREIH